MRIHWLARLSGLLVVVLISGCPKGGDKTGGGTSADTAAAARDSTATDTTP